ncbi:MAG: DUF5806 family protein, partial [Halobacteria archaeon]|nr:DUF5806 family protein [Halobacteria archaeon]
MKSDESENKGDEKEGGGKDDEKETQTDGYGDFETGVGVENENTEDEEGRETKDGYGDTDESETADSGMDKIEVEDADADVESRGQDDGEIQGQSITERTDGQTAKEGNGHTESGNGISKYDRFKKIEQSDYNRVNDFLRKRTYITAREWAIARLCGDFR